MKRILALLLSLCLLTGLFACGQPADDGETDETADTPSWQEQYDLGIRYLNEGNYQEAILAFTAAINIDPKRAEGYVGLADAYEAAGDWDRARETIEKAIKELGELDELLAVRRIHRQDDEPGYMTLLMQQEYSWPQEAYGHTWGRIVYHYDEYGYTLGETHEGYYYDAQHHQDVLSYTEYTEMTYEPGKDEGTYEAYEHRWIVLPDGRVEDYGIDDLGAAGPMAGLSTGFTGSRGLCMDPWLNEYRYCPLRVENDYLNSETDWAWAEVTYDERGYPVAYTSYDSSGEVCGTAQLYWETVAVLTK